MVMPSRTFFGQVLGKSCVYFLFWFATQQQGVNGVLGCFYLAGAAFHCSPFVMQMVWYTHDLHDLLCFFSLIQVHYIMYVELKCEYGRIKG